MEAMVIGRAEYESVVKRATDAEALARNLQLEYDASQDEIAELEHDLRLTRITSKAFRECAQYFEAQHTLSYAALRDLRALPWWRRLGWALMARKR